VSDRDGNAEIYAMTAQRFRIAEHLMTTREWDLLMMLDMGVDRIQHGFWKYMDPSHPKHEPGHPLGSAILNYYEFVDGKIGRLLERTPDDCVIFVLSDHGAQPMRGGICVNEWLYREGFLALAEPPTEPTPFNRCNIDWARTAAWGEGGYYGRISLNVQGREPEGFISQTDYEDLRTELIEGLEGIGDEHDRPIGSRVYRPEELYPETAGVPPDLIAYFGDLSWRSVGRLGTHELHTFENDTGPDDANHGRDGIFIQSGNGTGQELKTASLLDVAPTILDALGLDPPSGAEGTSLF
jgi:predicted AlkP superfamily phosphohydrolase/phosphomutase